MNLYQVVESVKEQFVTMDDLADTRFREAFAARLKEAIRRSPYRTQRAFAQAIGLPENTVSRYCRAEHFPQALEMQKIASGL